MRRAALLAVLLLGPPAPAADGPNLLADVSRAFVSAAVGETRDRPETINDTIMGTRVTGSGYSHSEVTVEFVPCADRAVAELVLTGCARTRTVGVTGPVRVYTNGLTRFTGRKRVSTDGERLDWCPATVRVHQDTDLAGVGTRFKGVADRVVSKVATRSFYKGQDEANRESERMTRRDIQREFDQDADKQLAEGDRWYREELREPLRQRGLWPQEVRTASTADWLLVRGTLTGVVAGGWGQPPAVAAGTDIVVRVHESFFNNAAAKHYGGRTVTGEELDRDFTFLIGPQSPAGGRLEPEEKQQFTVTFAPAPLDAAFAERQVRAILHTRGFQSEDRVIDDPYDIRVAYDLERTAAGLVLTRKALEMLPPDVAAGKRRMSARENSTTKLLGKRFEKLLPARQEVEIGTIPGLEKVGRIVPTQADAAGGWLAVGWRATK